MLVARGTPGFSGADLANLLNQAAIHATQERHDSVLISDMEWAKDKILMGMFAVHIFLMVHIIFLMVHIFLMVQERSESPQ